MLGGGQGRSNLRRVRQSGDANSNFIGRDLRANAGSFVQTDFSQSAADAENAGKNRDQILFVAREPAEFAAGVFRLFAPGIADRQDNQRPLFGAPTGGRGTGRKKPRSGFLLDPAVTRRTNPVENGNRGKRAAHAGIPKNWSAMRAAARFQDGFRKARGLRGFPAVRIARGSSDAKPRECSGFEFAVSRQAEPPAVRETCGPESELTIGLDARSAVGGDFLFPGGGFGSMAGGSVPAHEFAQDVEIVNVAEEILKALQVIAPDGVTLRQEGFDGVTEAFYANAKLVPGLGAFGAQREAVEFPNVFEAFEGEAFRSGTCQGNKPGAALEDAREAAPALFLEARGFAEGFFAELRFAVMKCGGESGAESISRRSELPDPLLLDLRIAQAAQAAEESASQFAHFFPGGMRVDFFHGGRERTAAAERHAKVVDSVGGGRLSERLEFGENAVHPMRQTAVLDPCSTGKGNYAGHKILDCPLGLLGRSVCRAARPEGCTGYS